MQVRGDGEGKTWKITTGALEKWRVFIHGYKFDLSESVCA